MKKFFKKAGFALLSLSVISTIFVPRLCIQAAESLPETAGQTAEETAQLQSVSRHADWDLETIPAARNIVRVQLSMTRPESSFYSLQIEPLADVLLESDTVTEDGKHLASLSVHENIVDIDLSEYGLQWANEGHSLLISFTLAAEADLDEVLLHTSDRQTLISSWNLDNSSVFSLYSSSREKTVTPLSGTTAEKIAELKELFPENSYWNHKAGENPNDYSPESVTDHPCSSHENTGTGEYICNLFDNYSWCNGFAYLCYYKFNGVRFSDSHATVEVEGDQDLKVGDVIFTKTAEDSPQGHYSFVQKISGNTVYKLEANYAGNCRIYHSSSVKRSDVITHWTPATISVHYNSNGGLGSMSDKSFSCGGSCGLDNIGFYKNGYQFGGWNIRNGDSGYYVYTNGENTAEFESDETARENGYSRKVLPNGGTLSSTDCSAGSIELVAVWNTADPVDTVMYRLYNPNTGEHFYTSGPGEKNSLVNAGWKDEGTGWTAPSVSNTPVFRVYNPNSGDHHYTTNEAEKNSLVSCGWKSEGIGWFSDDEQSAPLYREYNPNAKTGTHNYTKNLAEHKRLVSLGWKDEGIGWYGRN